MERRAISGGDAVSAAPAIAFEDVRTRYGSREVLSGVSFALPASRISVMLGPSGVGKSTCVRHLAGLRPPDGGRVVVEGRSLWAMSRQELSALRRRSGLMLQGTGLYGSALWESMSVLDNVRFQLRALTDLDDDLADARARERLHAVGLGDRLGALPGELSAGMRRRAALARALASDPDFAVLDGLELGLDGVRRELVCDLVREHQSRAPSTMLVVTQDMEVARRLADHVVVLLGGRVAAEGRPDVVLDGGTRAVRQLVEGDRRGPLALASAPEEMPATPAPVWDSLYDLPLWIAALALVVCGVASALVLGAR